MIKHINEESLKKEINKNSGVCLVDFYATWCGPCQMLAPVLEEVSKDMKDKVNFFAVDVDQAQDVCSELGIMSVPSIFIFKDGSKVAFGKSYGYEADGSLKNIVFDMDNIIVGRDAEKEILRQRIESGNRTVSVQPRRCSCR